MINSRCSCGSQAPRPHRDTAAGQKEQKKRINLFPCAEATRCLHTSSVRCFTTAAKPRDTIISDTFCFSSPFSATVSTLPKDISKSLSLPARCNRDGRQCPILKREIMMPQVHRNSNTAKYFENPVITCVWQRGRQDRVMNVTLCYCDYRTGILLQIPISRIRYNRQ